MESTEDSKKALAVLLHVLGGFNGLNVGCEALNSFIWLLVTGVVALQHSHCPYSIVPPAGVTDRPDELM